MIDQKHPSGQTVWHERDSNGRNLVHICTDQASATLDLLGAQLLSWTPAGQTHPVLWLPDDSPPKTGRPWRGGAPLCWPWFGAHPRNPGMSAHGVARTTPWILRRAIRTANGQMALQLHPVLPQPDWPRQIGLEYEIRVGESLELHLTTRNDGPVAVSVSEALHSYFRIGDIRSVAIDGLDTHDYVDKLQDGQRRRQTGTLTFSSETDRIYQSAPRHCIIVDPVLNRRIHLQQDNAASTIVWNPWQKKAAQLGDLGPGHHGNGGWNDMVCVESGNALEHAVSVEPGSSHTLSVCYSVC